MQADIASPCSGICRIDKDRQLCEGCLRTLDEIGRWSIMNRDQKLSVLQACLDRQQLPDKGESASPAQDPDTP